MKNVTLFGIDFHEVTSVKPVGLEVIKSGVGIRQKYSLESVDHSGFDASLFDNKEFDARYFFKDLSPSDVEDLLQGRAYLEFWLPVVDHDLNRMGVSGNGKYYSAEDIEGAMTEGFRNRMSTGGVEGELDHPALKMYSDNEKSKMNFQNNIDRIGRIDKDNVVWYVVAYKRVNDISFFKFRTSLSNTKVVKDMLNGKAPSASLRVMGDFSIDASTGLWRGKNIRFVTIDYVDNPGFKTASLFKGAIDLVKSGTNDLKKVEFTNNVNKTSPFALESIEDTKFVNDSLSKGENFMVNDLFVAVVDPSTKVKPRKSLEDILNSISIL